jgi:hypothetical protein
MTEGQSACLSWCRAPLGDPWPAFSFPFLLSDNCFALRFGAPSLTRGLVSNWNICFATAAFPSYTEFIYCRGRLKSSPRYGISGSLSFLYTFSSRTLPIYHTWQQFQEENFCLSIFVDGTVLALSAEEMGKVRNLSFVNSSYKLSSWMLPICHICDSETYHFQSK